MPNQSTLEEIPLLVILAPPRCYTTLVCAMLGEHPQMYGLPETHLFTSGSMEEWWASHNGSDRTDGLSRAVAQIMFQSQTEATIRRARQWLRHPPRSTADVLRDMARQVSPLMLVEKTPQASERIDHLRRIDALFPHARFLHLLRHPLGHVLSRLERRLKNLRKTVPGIDLVQAAQRFAGADPQMLWLRCNSNIVSFLNCISPERQMRIRGEDLLGDPDQHLRDITVWLKVRSDPEAIEAMKHPERSPFACFGPPNAPMGGDENFFRNPALRPLRETPQSLNGPVPWREDSEGFRPVIIDLARSFGYT
jgi:hypothetical protein